MIRLVIGILLTSTTVGWAFEGTPPTVPANPATAYGYCHCPPRDDAMCSAVIWTQKPAPNQGARVLCDCVYGDDTAVNPYTVGVPGVWLSCRSGPCDAGQGCTVQQTIKRATNTSGPCTAGCYQRLP